MRLGHWSGYSMTTPRVRSADEEEVERLVRELFPFRKCGECGEFLNTHRGVCSACGAHDNVPSFRQYQEEATIEAAKALFVEGYNNVILDLPTGVGKSPTNVTLALLANELFDDKAFYTTPQKSLRNQLANDDDLNEHVEMLKARRDYTCGATGKNSDECPVNLSSDKSCRATDGCTYWAAKMDAINSDIAAITFAMLVVDNYIPPVDEYGNPISFDDRGMLIVDEVHGLEGQVSSLFAGFTASFYKLPDRVFEPAIPELRRLMQRAERNDDLILLEDAKPILKAIADRAQEYAYEFREDQDRQSEVDACKDYQRKLSYAINESEEEDRPWVIDIEPQDVSWRNATDDVKVEVQPIDVDRFLQKFVWSRGEKRVLSSATIPYPGKPEVWAERIGLDPDRTKLISKPMPFPAENRQVHTHSSIDKFSGGGDEENWNEIINTINEIHANHKGQKGLVHTASYDRAQKLADSLGHDRVYVHSQEEDTSEEIRRWQESDKDIMASPSMMEGVDLYDDRARWQILLKVPYLQSGDSRVKFMLDERKDWEWYYQEAYMDLVQSVGRAVRSSDDFASYYVLDESFKDVMGRVTPPTWFMEAIQKRPPRGEA